VASSLQERRAMTSLRDGAGEVRRGHDPAAVNLLPLLAGAFGIRLLAILPDPAPMPYGDMLARWARTWY